jgi:hypothetical protein
MPILEIGIMMGCMQMRLSAQRDGWDGSVAAPLAAFCFGFFGSAAKADNQRVFAVRS